MSQRRCCDQYVEICHQLSSDTQSSLHFTEGVDDGRIDFYHIKRLHEGANCLPILDWPR